MKKHLPLIFFLSALLFVIGVYVYGYVATSPVDAFRAELSRYQENRDIPKGVYEKYYESVGPEMMLNIIDERPACHVEGHNLGRVLYEHTRDLPRDVYICRGKCYSGCMHGALLGFVNEEREKTGLTGDPQPEDLTPTLMQKIIDLCDNSLITKYTGHGSCYHSLGHVFAYFTDSDLKPTQNLCRALEAKGQGAVAQCVNGAYMQRSLDYGDVDIQADATKLYPCNVGDYPAGCYVYRLPLLYGSTTPVQTIVDACNALSSPDRAACFYGIGSNYYALTKSDPAIINTLCASDDTQAKKMCLDGVLGRLTSYDLDEGEHLCGIYTGLPKRECLKHTKSIFDLTRDYSGYLLRR